MLKRIWHAIRNWWECRTKRCEYYRHYLAYGPAELTHIGYHSAERLSKAHFDSCQWSQDRACPACSRWEKALRA